MTTSIDSLRTPQASFNTMLASLKQSGSQRAAALDATSVNHFADVVAGQQAAAMGRSTGAGGVALQPPSRDALDAVEGEALLALLQSGNAESAEVNTALAALLQSVMRTLDGPTQDRIERTGGTVPIELLDSASFVTLQRDLQTLIGLVSANGAMTLPTVRDLAALSGRAPPSSPQHALLRDALNGVPEFRDALQELASLEEDELPVRMKLDPRLAYVLILVATLMAAAAIQRELGVAMLEFAERAVRDMGVKMVESAKQQQMAKVVALVVVVVVAVAAVGVGAAVATRNVASVRNNQTKANDLNANAARNEVRLARGVNEAPTKASSSQSAASRNRSSSSDRQDAQQAPMPMNAHQRATLRESINNDRNEAATLMAEHGVNQTQAAVGTQISQVTGQSANSAGQLAGSGHEIEAAHLTAQQEKRRADSSTGQQVSQAVGQNVSKLDESSSTLFRQVQQAEQEKADARNDITRHIR